MITRELILQLQKIAAPGRVREKEILASHSSFRTGGPADLFIEVCDREELTKVMDLLAQSQTEVFLLGRGTNLLIGDGGYRGAVVTMCAPAGTETALNRVEVDGTMLRAGIPGSLGGAVMMNAGAYGGEMKQVMRSVDVLYPGKEVRTYSGEEMEFGYRTSRLKREDGIVLAAAIELAPGDKQAITDRITELAQQRKDKQPLEFASAGSTFKRPEGYFAGKLIQDAGLKGFRVGDAQVSEKHAGFVINRGNASAAQIRKLIEEVQRIVLEDAGVQLEREVIFLGEF